MKTVFYERTRSPAFRPLPDDGWIRPSPGSPRPGSGRLREAPVAQRGRRGAEFGAEGDRVALAVAPRGGGRPGLSQAAAISAGHAPPRPEAAT